jgi:hypothetical protein
MKLSKGSLFVRQHPRRFALVVVIFAFLTVVPVFGDGLGKWRADMTAMAKEMNVLAPYLFDAAKFSDPKNTPLLKKAIHEASERVNGLDFSRHGDGASQKQFLNDPALAYVGSRLKEQLQAASEAFENRQFEYARYALTQSTTYCISCHTMGQVGNQFPTSALLSGLSSATPRERIAFLAATRQFDAALIEFSSYVNEVKLKGPGFMQTERNPIRVALAVAIRVRNDPSEGLALLNKISTLPGLSTETTETIAAWRKSLNAWINETPTPEHLQPNLEEADRVIARARAAQRYPFDERADIEFLRATAILHGILRSSPAESVRAQVFWRLGDSYQVLQELGLWGLHEFYFESCVRAEPHSKVAEKCYASYEESVSDGFTGSAGKKLPAPIASHLQELKGLATQITKKN